MYNLIAEKVLAACIPAERGRAARHLCRPAWGMHVIHMANDERTTVTAVAYGLSTRAFLL